MATAQTTVRYRPIKDFPGYRVGDDGSVWTSWRKIGLGNGGGVYFVIGSKWKQLRPGRAKSGHLSVRLARGGAYYSRWVHRLVLEAFVGPCPPGMQCRHFDGNPANNRLGNLRWGTKRENCADTVRHGRSTRGERDAMAKLTTAAVKEIRRRYAAGETQRSIAADKGVCQRQISRVVRGENWSHLARSASCCPAGSYHFRRGRR